MTAEGVRLTPQQNAVVESGPETRLVVLAPAGTGKTEVLTARLRYLMSTHDLHPGDDLLVLSFSRAAVREVKRRLRRDAAQSAGVNVATFDSFATRCLALYSGDGAWETESYDRRIKRVTQLIAASAEFRDAITGYRHVLIDEIQDLVGDRAELVRRLLEELTFGFTLFGDPAQGIYGFQLEGATSDLTSRALLGWVLESLQPAPRVVELDRNFRATSDALLEVTDAGPALRHIAMGTHSKDSLVVRRQLEDHLYRLDIVDFRTLGLMLRRLRADPGNSAAVLCRFNGQALVISARLHDVGIPHRLQETAEDRPLSSWVANVLFEYRFARISRSRFEKRLEVLGSSHPPAEEAWRSLKSFEGRSGVDLQLSVLNARIHAGPVPDDLAVVPEASVVVSTVHRAKGLEWDAVVLCGLEEPFEKGDLDEETRILYVAMTRARENLFVLKAPELGNLRSKEQSDRRWIRSDPRSRVLTQVEILPDDVHSDDPAGAFLLGTDPLDAQSYLRGVMEGDLVELVCIRSSMDGQPRAYYRIDHAGRPIGVTSDVFARSLIEILGRLGRTSDGFPQKLSGVRVYAVETIAGSRAAGAEAGLGTAGIWLRPRLYGLGDVEWRRN